MRGARPAAAPLRFSRAEHPGPCDGLGGLLQRNPLLLPRCGGIPRRNGGGIASAAEEEALPLQVCCCTPAAAALEQQHAVHRAAPDAAPPPAPGLTRPGRNFSMQHWWQLRWQQGVRTIAAMNDAPNTFRALDREWAMVGSSARARAALRRWAEAEPALDPYSSPAQVVTACQRRGDLEGSRVLLGAVLRLAHDDLAARTMLQAVLPSLAARAWRAARRTRCRGNELGDCVEELNAEVLAAAVERIGELAGTSPAWPAQAVVEHAWRRARDARERRLRHQGRSVSLAAAAHQVAGRERSAAEALTAAVLGAVQAGHVQRRDGAVIVMTRVLGYAPEEVAAYLGRDVRTLRMRRLRAERAMVAAG